MDRDVDRDPSAGVDGLAALDREIAQHARSADPSSRVKAANALVDKGEALVRLRRYDHAIRCFDEVVEEFGDGRDSGTGETVSNALVKKGSALLQQGRFVEANKAFDFWCARAMGSSNPELARRQMNQYIARSFYVYAREAFDAGSYRQVVATAEALRHRSSADFRPQQLEAFVKLLRLQGFAEAASGHELQAVSLLGDLVERYRYATEPGVMKAVASSLNKKADLLESHGEHERALESYNELLTRFRDVSDPALRESVAVALHNRLVFLQSTSRYEESLAAADEVIELFATDPLPKRPYLAVDAFAGKAFFLRKLGRYGEAVSVCDEFVRRYRDESDAYVLTKIAIVLGAKVDQLLERGCVEEVILTVDQLVGRFGHTTDPEQRAHVADALFAKARALGKLDRWKLALAVDEWLIADYADAISGAWPQSHGATARREIGDVKGAITAWSEVIERYGDQSAPELRELVTSAQTAEAELLALSGRLEETIEVGDAMIGRAYDGGDPAQAGQAGLAAGLGAKGAALVADGRYEEGIVILDELLARFASAAQTELRRQAALALSNKALALDRLGREQESASVHDEIVAHYAEEAIFVFDRHFKHCEGVEGPIAREQMATLLYNKAWVLGDLGRRSEAAAVLTQLIQRFADDDSFVIQRAVSTARQARDEMASGPNE